MTQERAKLLLKIIFIFAALIVAILFVVVVAQTIKHNSLLAQIDNVNAQTEQIKTDGEKLDEKLSYYTDDPNANDIVIKDEIIDDYLLQEGYVPKNGSVEVFE